MEEVLDALLNIELVRSAINDQIGCRIARFTCRGTRCIAAHDGAAIVGCNAV